MGRFINLEPDTFIAPCLPHIMTGFDDASAIESVVYSVCVRSILSKVGSHNHLTCALLVSIVRPI